MGVRSEKIGVLSHVCDGRYVTVIPELDPV